MATKNSIYNKEGKKVATFHYLISNGKVGQFNLAFYSKDVKLADNFLKSLRLSVNANMLTSGL